jgi:hypothetical protein
MARYDVCLRLQQTYSRKVMVLITFSLYSLVAIFEIRSERGSIMLKNFYLVCAIIGTLIPWVFFGRFFAAEGINIPLFIQGLFANGAAGGFVADVLISIIVFLVWSYDDSRKLGVRHWWVILPATFFVGLSLAFPLYLYMRFDYQS